MNKTPSRLPSSLATDPALDSWIKIESDGTVTVNTGKVEIGQGIRTAGGIIAAEEMDLSMERIRVQCADTALTPDEGTTSGSHSMEQSGHAVRQVAAECRQVLLAMASDALGVETTDLEVDDGTIRSRQTNTQTDYWTLMAGKKFGCDAAGDATPKDPATHKLVGTAIGRLDGPAKVFGEAIFVQDLDLPGMVHGRIVRPTSQLARLTSVDTAKVEAMTGVIKVVRDGDFLGVIAEREVDAMRARDALAEASVWETEGENPDEDRLAEWMLSQVTMDRGVIDGIQTEDCPEDRDPPKDAVVSLESYFTKPYILHGAMGPSCAVAEMSDDKLNVWTHSQGVYPLRGSLALFLKMDIDHIRCTHMDGAGCYGHNAADDVALDAALLARALPGRPVRVQWRREDEHAWEPFSTPMVVKVKASVGGDGKVSDWQFDFWSHNHGQRPRPSKEHSSLLAASKTTDAWPVPAKNPNQGLEAGEHRNAWPAYTFKEPRLRKHFLPNPTFRCSSLRGLGTLTNVFAIETMMDDLAHASGQDAVAFRLKHLDDPRARDVVEATAEAIGWDPKSWGNGRAQGLAYNRYKNSAAYCAVAIELTVDAKTGVITIERVASAVDAGEAVSPDGVANQVEGGVVQTISWALKERVRFDPVNVTSLDWESYPILKLPESPETKIVVMARPGTPYLGVGEASQGPTPAAISSAVRRAIGAQLREMPFTPERVRAMIAEAGHR